MRTRSLTTALVLSASAACKDWDRFGLEGQVGVGGSFLDIEAATAGTSDATHVHTVGFLLGGSASYRLLDPLEFFYGVRVFQGLSDLDDVEIFTVQLGAAWTLTEHLTLSAGLQDWDYSAEREEGFPDPSDLELGLDGVFVRLDVTL